MKNKIIYSTSLLAAISMIAGTFYYKHACRSLEDAASIRLSALCAAKKEKIEHYFNELSEHIKQTANEQTTRSAMLAFKAAFIATGNNIDQNRLEQQKDILYLYYQDKFIRKLNFHLTDKKTVEVFLPQDPSGIILQTAYIAENPHPVGSKEKLISAPEAGQYDAVHKEYHPLFYERLEKFKYYDMFLIDTINGTIYYTVAKEIDFANNLKTTELRESNLAQLIAVIDETAEPKITDFKFYDPSYAAPAAFIGLPIYDENKKNIGVLVIQIPNDHIDNIMTDDEKWSQVGLGQTGEAYLVGSDLTMRSISRFLIENKFEYIKILEKQKIDPQIIQNINEFEQTILLQTVDTPPAHAALKGKTGVMKSINYLGIPVLSAYAPLDLKGLKWAVLTEQSLDEICKPVRERFGIVIFLILFILIAFFSGLLLYYTHKPKSTP